MHSLLVHSRFSLAGIWLLAIIAAQNNCSAYLVARTMMQTIACRVPKKALVIAGAHPAACQEHHTCSPSWFLISHLSLVNLNGKFFLLNWHAGCLTCSVMWSSLPQS